MISTFEFINWLFKEMDRQTISMKAMAIDLGVSRSTLSNWKHIRNEMPLSFTIAMLHILGYDISVINMEGMHNYE